MWDELNWEGKRKGVRKKGGKMYPLTRVLLHVGSAQKTRSENKRNVEKIGV